MIDLSEKTILLTGASGDIGSATAVALGEAGAYVVAHYVNDREGAERATSAIAPERKTLIQADFAQAGGGRDLWARALEWRGHVDVLVNNAAIMPDSFIDGEDALWDDAWARALQINVVEPANLVRGAVRHFRDTNGGIIISLSSWSAQQGSAIPQLTAYASTKAAIKALTQTVARAHAKDNVLAYVVAPGIVDTTMSQISVTSRGGMDALKAILPLGEMVPTREIGDLIAFLCTGTCRHLSGATIDMNGAAYVR